MSITEALKDEQRTKETIDSILAEVMNMIDKKVGDLIKFEDIPKEFRANIVNALMFLKDKFDGDGAFIKRKSRMVASTTEQVFADTSSPTVNTITVMSMLHIAAAKDYELAACDCEGAFLGTPVDHSKDGRTFTRVPASS